MRSKPVLLLLALLCALALGASACGSDDETGESTDTDTSTTAAEGDGDTEDTDAAPSDLDLVSDGTLTVCSDIPYEPFEFEGEDGELTGYDIDLLSEIASDNGLEIDVRTTPFDTIIASLIAGDCDVIGSAMTITDERAEQVGFSEPYFDADQSLLVPTGSDVAALADLEGGSIGVQAATTGSTYADENAPDGAEIREYPGAAELFAALEAGEIEAILQDFPVNAYRATQDDSVEVTESFPTGEQYGFAVELENEALLTAVDDSLTAMRDDGRFDEIFGTYFG